MGDAYPSAKFDYFELDHAGDIVGCQAISVSTGPRAAFHPGVADQVPADGDIEFCRKIADMIQSEP